MIFTFNYVNLRHRKLVIYRGFAGFFQGHLINVLFDWIDTKILNIKVILWNRVLSESFFKSDKKWALIQPWLIFGNL